MGTTIEKPKHKITTAETNATKHHEVMTEPESHQKEALCKVCASSSTAPIFSVKICNATPLVNAS